jgi:hypothetical protein
MRLTRLGTALATSLALAVAPHALAAQTVTFSFDGTVGTPYPFAGLALGAYSFVFTLPQSPTPSSVDTFQGYFALNSVTGLLTQDGVTTSRTGNLFFRTGGGFFYVPVGGAVALGISSPVLFSGTLQAPTFILGAGTNSTPTATPASVSNYSIAAVSTVPEPGTWALLGTGLLAVGGIAARRKRTTG